VTELMATLRAIVRQELSRVRMPELGIVTQVHAHDGDDSPSNHQVNVRLRSSGVELQRVAVATARLGLSALPNENDLVLVNFVGGDLNLPVVVGCVYDDQAHPPTAQLHEVHYQPPDEEDSAAKRVLITLPSGCTLAIQDEAVTVTMGDTEVVVNKDGDVTVNAKGKVSIQSQDDVEVQAQGNLKMSAQGNVEVEAQGDLKMSATGNASLKGMATTVEGQSEAKLKGPSVSLAGNTQFSPS
jgi:phage baseplate assembly protein gpV